ncbi:hypothetical protein DFJ74DRAFT_773401 [Hyaloraphidium curvatum]|nr:hypothetical protein DFJ74DRAFT_773401 [Hyaloraphidium curvatum]
MLSPSPSLLLRFASTPVLLFPHVAVRPPALHLRAASSSPAAKPGDMKKQAADLIDEGDDYGFAIPPDKDPLEKAGKEEQRRRMRSLAMVLGAGAAIGGYLLLENEARK